MSGASGAAFVLAGLPLAAGSAAAVHAEVLQAPGTEAARVLLRTGAWRDFRAFWKRSTALEGQTAGRPGFLAARIDTLDSLVAALRAEAGDSVVSACVSRLGKLCADRMSMSAYGLPETLTRMIPSRAVFHEETALRRLEGRIAAIREISHSPLESAPEMAEVLGGAVREATSAILFDALSTGWILPHDFPSASQDSLPTSELLRLDLAALDSAVAVCASEEDTSIRAACMSASDEIGSIQASLPVLDILLGDLLAPR